MVRWSKKDVIKAFNEAMQPAKQTQKASLSEQIDQLTKVRKVEIPTGEK